MYTKLRSVVDASIFVALVTLAGAISAQSSTNINDTLRHRKAAGVTYISGGVGTDDVARMRELAPRFNVRIRFQNLSDGASLSDIKVIILNEKRINIMNIVTEGPLLYIKISPGRYYLAAVYENTVQERMLVVKQKSQNITISFQVNELEDSWRYCDNGNEKCPRRSQR